MRVVHLIKTAYGASWAWEQIRVLRSLGVEVDVVLAEPGPMRARYASLGVPVYELPIDISLHRSAASWARAKREFRALISDLRPSIIHSHFVGTTLFARAALGGRSAVPRVFQVPGPLHLEKRVTRMVDLWSASQADYWIATCELTRTIYVSSGVAPERVGLSYYGNALKPQINATPTLRAELSLGNETAIIGMVAYIYPPKRWLGQTRGLKGHEDLVDALAILIAQGRDVVGVFVGGAWNGSTDYERAVKAYAKRRVGNRAIFLGTRDDVAAIYPALDLVVHPSHSENVGGAAESLLLGVPTVTTNVGGFPDVVIDGETGKLVPPKDPRALADAILFMLDNRASAKDMAVTGQRLVRKLFDVDRTAREVADFYDLTISNFDRVGRSRGV